ncbi:hypothetical protein BCR33DRAFT_566313 [Rhizoclosmatium globosum]|uniref:Uncharacterized protein n=1 Tax=Rhizoclosmatium globosum TaxID=329046 RepID=A0A1Y2B6K2_9FUNG|nr:hypothetical protein BCR33DRAFT_566313 [Rhizoclosmatium globosum]|eukprot:ORY30463.1 hypothetical protein BCR33DRAFT_566313 [Rhizoclosmatium globosum]
MFGAASISTAASTAVPTSSAFGSGGSVFGSAQPAPSSTTSGFSFLGAAASKSSSPAPPSVFGNASPANTTPSSQTGFGQGFTGSGTSAFGSKPTAFGQPANASAQPPFGQSGFGAAAATPSSNAFSSGTTPVSAFGKPTAFGNSASGSAFGQNTQTAVPAFGQPASTQSAFGQSTLAIFFWPTKYSSISFRSRSETSWWIRQCTGNNTCVWTIWIRTSVSIWTIRLWSPCSCAFPSVSNTQSVFGQSSNVAATGFGSFASTSNQSVFGGGATSAGFGAAASNTSVFGNSAAQNSTDKKPSFSQYR